MAVKYCFALGRHIIMLQVINININRAFRLLYKNWDASKDLLEIEIQFYISYVLRWKPTSNNLAKTYQIIFGNGLIKIVNDKASKQNVIFQLWLYRIKSQLPWYKCKVQSLFFYHPFYQRILERILHDTGKTFN